LAQTGQLQIRIDFNKYLDALYGYAVVLSRNSTEAEDLVQETCLRALRSIGQLRPDGNAKSWLFTILRNIWLKAPLDESVWRACSPNGSSIEGREQAAPFLRREDGFSCDRQTRQAGGDLTRNAEP